MSHPAETNYQTTQLIRTAVRKLGSIVINDGEDDFEVAMLPLKNPRVIGEHTATHIRLAAAKAGSVVATATYQHTPATYAPGEPGRGLPLRHITLPSEGSPEGVFNGYMNADEYVVPPQYMDDLVLDIFESLIAKS